MSKFIDDKTVLRVRGIGKVTSENITPKLYKRLIAISPSYEKYFVTKKATTDGGSK